MTLLSSTVFQPPLPPVLDLLPPLSPIQWLPRALLLAYTIIVTFPLILVLIPLSLVCAGSPSPSLRRLQPLPIHPDNLPASKGWITALWRGWWVYMVSGIVWSITSLGAPPVCGERETRWVVYASLRVVETGANIIEWVGSKGRRTRGQTAGKLSVQEVRIPDLDPVYKLGLLRDVVDDGRRHGREGILGFWLTNTDRAPSVSPKKIRRDREHIKRTGKPAGDRSSKHRSLSSEEEADITPFVAPFEPPSPTSPTALISPTIPECAVQPVTASAIIIGGDDPFALVGADGADMRDILAYTSPRKTTRPKTRPSLSSRHTSSQLRTVPMSAGGPQIEADRKVYLFFAGGGYVTGWPLVHPAIYSLARTFESEPQPKHIGRCPSTGSQTSLPRRSIFAPNIRKSLSLAHAFPIPLIDAVAAYVHLLELGYAPEEIVLIGDSAGGGLVWSVLAYLCALAQHQERTGARSPGRRSAEISVRPPGGVIMISPWLSLPPTPPTEYPDFLDTPQLLNAARSYMARFPIIASRPDPFSSELGVWASAYMHGLQRVLAECSGWRRLVAILHGSGTSSTVQGTKKGGQIRNQAWTEAPAAGSPEHKRVVDMVAEWEMRPHSDAPPPYVQENDSDLLRWLDMATFIRMTSHHPLVSPCTPDDALSSTVQGQGLSPFVLSTLAIAKRYGTRMLLVSGTAEWFHRPAHLLVDAARAAVVQVETYEEVGGFHCESCLLLGEMPGPGRRLVQTVRRWSGDTAV